uniref:Phytocyanin domain-containing protein n=1 Tax=Fagus sylvatica TaxID=28930 RepID=A0A2N9GKS9_FAGSY
MEGLRPEWAVKAILVIIITSILIRSVSATNHSVGGSSGWDLASDLQAWSAATTFHVGDSLVFTYTPLHDVLEVEQSDYDMCRISDPLKTYRDGETVIQLSEADNRYFICGRLGHCDMGLKLQVQVQTTNGNSTGGSGQEQRQRGRGRSSPPPHSPGPDHDHESPPSNRSRDHKPESPDSASVSQPPVANPPFNTSAGCSHVESSLCLNCWCLPFITTLLLLIVIFSSCPDRQMLSFFFNFSHLSYVI